MGVLRHSHMHQVMATVLPLQ
uniref:Uncharacterized protein n=1 Tax=Arundo donax TaxID=35708 RepID=A0A0A9FNQ3_ARUDO